VSKILSLFYDFLVTVKNFRGEIFALCSEIFSNFFKFIVQCTFSQIKSIIKRKNYLERYLFMSDLLELVKPQVLSNRPRLIMVNSLYF